MLSTILEHLCRHEFESENTEEVLEIYCAASDRRNVQVESLLFSMSHYIIN
jgi:hypothetical protein